MGANPFLGVFLHAIGGLAAGSFYIPYKGVRGWAWESYWLVGGVMSWLIAPWVVALLTAPDVLGVLSSAPLSSIFLCYLFGVLWGVGGLTFGLSMRYLGISLGYAIALGFCAAMGTLIPPFFSGEIAPMLATTSGRVVLLGVGVCLAGIAVCGHAGIRKERELPASGKTEIIAEFNFVRGMWVAVFAGVMSACMSFGISAGDPIAKLALQHGAAELWQNTPVFIVILAGGFTTNFVWCVYLNWKNKTARDYARADVPRTANYIFSAMAGLTWYLQFMFYGMGTTQMGRYGFASWTLHMAFIIVFSNIWALALREWKGCRRQTVGWIVAGLAVLVLSTIVIGYGNKLAAPGPKPAEATSVKAEGDV